MIDQDSRGEYWYSSQASNRPAKGDEAEQLSAQGRGWINAVSEGIWCTLQVVQGGINI